MFFEKWQLNKKANYANILFILISWVKQINDIPHCDFVLRRISNKLQLTGKFGLLFLLKIINFIN